MLRTAAIAIASSLATMALVVSCAPERVAPAQARRGEPDPGVPLTVRLVACEDAYCSDPISLWTDPETGCGYVIYGRYYGGGITPRLGPDGRPFCTPPVQP